MRAGPDVREDGVESLPLDRVRRGDEGERRDYHLVVCPRCPGGDLQAEGRVAYGDHVSDIPAPRELRLELLDHRAVVGEPASIEDALDPLRETGTVTDVRSADVEGLGEPRAASERGEPWGSHHAHHTDDVGLSDQAGRAAYGIDQEVFVAFLSASAMRRLGIAAGDGVLLSEDARVYGAERLTIGDNVRIDAFCVISTGRAGQVSIGSHVHIASGTRIFGEGGVKLEDFSSASSGTTIYSASDDYSGDHLMGPMIDDRFTDVDVRPVVLRRFAAVGAHSLVLPGVEMAEGAVLGAMSMAARDLEPWMIHVGAPCKPLRARNQRLADLAREFLDSRGDRRG